MFLCPEGQVHVVHARRRVELGWWTNVNTVISSVLFENFITWWLNQWFIYLLVATRAVLCGNLLALWSSGLDFSGFDPSGQVADPLATCVKCIGGVDNNLLGLSAADFNSFKHSMKLQGIYQLQFTGNEVTTLPQSPFHSPPLALICRRWAELSAPIIGDNYY